MHKFISIMALAFVLLVQCQQPQEIQLQNGDLIFCAYEDGELSGAIDEVTQTNETTHFSHMGILEIEGNDTTVIHASPKKGVVKESLQVFITTQEASQMVVYRLKPEEQSNIEQALDQANKMVGLPYNFSYLMNDTCYYCSQLIYEIFTSSDIFKLEPMTFKSPKTNTFHEGWISYYQKLGMEIPEGQPGCNPNGLAASDHLVRVGLLSTP